LFLTFLVKFMLPNARLLVLKGDEGASLANGLFAAADSKGVARCSPLRIRFLWLLERLVPFCLCFVRKGMSEVRSAADA